jgi:hypothetical protein
MGTDTTQDPPDNSRRDGDLPLGREQASEGERLSRHRLPARATERSSR